MDFTWGAVNKLRKKIQPPKSLISKSTFRSSFSSSLVFTMQHHFSICNTSASTSPTSMFSFFSYLYFAGKVPWNKVDSKFFGKFQAIHSLMLWKICVRKDNNKLKADTAKLQQQYSTMSWLQPNLIKPHPQNVQVTWIMPIINVSLSIDKKTTVLEMSSKLQEHHTESSDHQVQLDVSGRSVGSSLWELSSLYCWSSSLWKWVWLGWNILNSLGFVLLEMGIIWLKFD